MRRGDAIQTQTPPLLGGALLARRRAGPQVLAVTGRVPHIPTMITRAQWRWFIDHPVVEWSIFVIGLLLLFVVAPLVGAIPGPGGVIVAGIGLAMVLKTSMWAKRRYARFKRWQPTLFGRRFKPGNWTDFALRRRSARRRKELEKQRQAASVEEGQAN